MKNISSDIQSLIDQANVDQAAQDADTETRIAKHQEQQRLEAIANGVQKFTEYDFEKEFGHKPTLKKFCDA